MNEKDVPQDNSSTYQGHKKLVYATGNDGQYISMTSTGWDVESFATQMAIDDIKEQTEQALMLAKQGETSPLAYHMFNLRFDLSSLSQATGFFQWQIKRHLTPHVFVKLSPRKLNIYGKIMNLTLDELISLPEKMT